LTEWIDRPKMTAQEERVVATHDAGHAVCAMFCEHAAPIERISIQGDAAGALGFVRYQDPAHRYVVTRGELLDDLCVLLGGREAEMLLLDDVSIGASGDLDRATTIARSLVEEFGLGDEAVGIGQCRTATGERARPRQYSDQQLQAIDACVREILRHAQHRAAELVREHRALIETLRDLLLEKKVIDAATLSDVAPSKEKR
jgi:cell division protease FtsH